MEIIGLEIETKVKNVLHKHLKFDDWANLFFLQVDIHQFVKTITQELLADFIAFLHRDPSATGSASTLLNSSDPFHALIHYRLSNYFWYSAKELSTSRDIAQYIYSTGNRFSNIDIHPGAIIGERFVMDHANGTVIGETAIIGDDCYVLGNVILGARGIADNKSTKRHPTIGNNVQIGSNSRILGPVNIGDNVFISPFSVVVKDIPNNCRVSIVNQLQLTRYPEAENEIKPIIELTFFIESSIFVVTQYVQFIEATIVDQDHLGCTDFHCTVVKLRPGVFEIEISASEQFIGHSRAEREPAFLQLFIDERSTIIIGPTGLRKFLETLIRNYKEC